MKANNCEHKRPQTYYEYLEECLKKREARVRELARSAIKNTRARAAYLKELIEASECNMEFLYQLIDMQAFKDKYEEDDNEDDYEDEEDEDWDYWCGDRLLQNLTEPKCHKCGFKEVA